MLNFQIFVFCFLANNYVLFSPLTPLSFLSVLSVYLCLSLSDYDWTTDETLFLHYNTPCLDDISTVHNT